MMPYIMDIEFAPVQVKIAEFAVRVVALLAIPLLALACYWSARLARADHLYRADTISSVSQAVRLDPANARYQAWLAEIQEHEGQDPAAALQQAAALNPYDGSLLIRRGLRAEQQNNFAQAERDLLQAAAVDKQFDPRATLTQYYFRRGDSPKFWIWARQAFAIGYGDLAPLFHLCWRMTEDPQIIRAALPQDRAVAAGYLHFLLSENRLDAAATLAPDFAAQSTEPDRELLLSACDRFLAAAQTSAAVATWNALCASHVLPHQPLAPEHAASLTNGAFQFEPLQRAFDWRTTTHPEITVTREDPRALRISFSGRQPETAELLSQILPLQPHRNYRLSFHYQATDAGLAWQISGQRAALLPTTDWTPGVLVFPSGATSQATLVLLYQRPQGTARRPGTLTLRDLTLGFAE